jgi:hypothetical protein
MCRINWVCKLEFQTQVTDAEVLELGFGNSAHLEKGVQRATRFLAKNGGCIEIDTPDF